MSDVQGSSRGKPVRVVSHHAQHRLRSHHEAHAGEGEAEAMPVVKMEGVCGGEPAWVDEEAGLKKLIGELYEAGRFAYDTEFIGEHSYHPHLCLIQVATREKLALIDPLKVDLMAFWKVLADAKVAKLVHSGLQDVEPVLRHLGEPARNVWDVQVAGGFLGQTYPAGLTKLVGAFLGVDAGKSMKFSQWDHRPLSKSQRRYAADDVRYLPVLYERMMEKLKEKGREGWVVEECGKLSDPKVFEFDAENVRQKIRGSHRLKAKEQHRLQTLVTWREKIAEEQNVPARMIADDGSLLGMARNRPGSAGAVGRVKGLAGAVAEAEGEKVVELLAEADKEFGDVQVQRRYIRGEPMGGLSVEEYEKQIQEIWDRLTAYCTEQGVATVLVASKRHVGEWVRVRAAGKVLSTKWTQGWRGEFLKPLELW